MKTTAIDEGRVIKNDSGVIARAVYSAPEAMVVHIAVQPGGFVTPHVTPVDMEFFVLEGRGTFILGEESTEAGAGILISSPCGVPHGMRNAGPGVLRVLAIKNPRPANEC
jgi:mannose-6-phosphate isomerase-like protein (cupin superfamily)